MSFHSANNVLLAFLVWTWDEMAYQHWAMQKLYAMSPHGIPFQKLEIIWRTIDVEKDHIQMAFCIFLYAKMVNALKMCHIHDLLTRFKKPSNISFTCSNRKAPTIKMNGIDPLDTCPPPSANGSILAWTAHVSHKQRHLPFLLRLVARTSVTKLGRTANDVKIINITTIRPPSVCTVISIIMQWSACFVLTPDDVNLTSITNCG